MWLLTVWWMGSLCSPETLCLTLSLCTLTCQWQEVNNRTIFFAFVPIVGFPRARMMIPFIFHEVELLCSWPVRHQNVPIRWRAVALKCLITYSKVLGGGLCSPQVVWMGRRNLGKYSSGLLFREWGLWRENLVDLWQISWYFHVLAGIFLEHKYQSGLKEEGRRI